MIKHNETDFVLIRSYYLIHPCTISIFVNDADILGEIREDVHNYLGSTFRICRRSISKERNWNLYIDLKNKYYLDKKRNEGIGFQTYANAKGAYWIETNNTILVSFEKGSIQVMTPMEKTVYLFNSPDRYTLIQDIYNVVKWVNLDYISLKKGGVLHSSGVAYHSQGILFLGDKGSGKTTLTTYFLKKGAKFVASDKVYFWTEGSTIKVLGWTESYRISEGTMNLLFSGETLSKLNEYRHNKGMAYFVEDKFRYPPLTFLNIINSKSAYCSKLNYIILLTNSAAKHLLIRALEFTECASYLDNFLINEWHPKTSNPLGVILDYNNLKSVKFVVVDGRAHPAEMYMRITNFIGGQNI